jgi:hypothetical protein
MICTLIRSILSITRRLRPGLFLALRLISSHGRLGVWSTEYGVLGFTFLGLPPNR